MLKALLLALFLGTAVKSFVASTPTLPPQLYCEKIGALSKNLRENQLHAIQTAIEKTIQSADPTAQVGIKAVSLDEGTSLYKQNEQKRYVPASSLKLFVAAAALDILGPNYRFETKILTDGDISKGILKGNCYLLASGDPSLDSAGMEKLVDQMKLKGIEQIKGNLALDLTIFDQVTMGPGWMWDEEIAYWSSPLSALNIEHNCISFLVKPNLKVGNPCSVAFFPDFQGIDLINRSITRHLNSKEESIEIKRLSSRQFKLLGEMSPESEPRLFRIPISTPHLYAAEILKSLFIKNQITFQGNIEIKKCPAKAKVLGTHTSPKLSEILKIVLKDSDNLYANALFKKIGQKRFGSPGTWEKGSVAIGEFLSQKASINVDEIVIVDGSGESRYNLVSPNQMVTFLTWIHDTFPHARALKEALPISGVDGTLKRRMTTPFLKSKVRAKTGSMTGISSLCGYIEGKKKKPIAFAIFVNGYVNSGKIIKKTLEDEVCKVLATD